jgi:hypothetical protein
LLPRSRPSATKTTARLRVRAVKGTSASFKTAASASKRCGSPRLRKVGSASSIFFASSVQSEMISAFWS